MKLKGISSGGAKIAGLHQADTTLVRAPRKESLPSLTLAAWNKLLKKVESSRKSIVTTTPKFLHPWSVIIEWLPEKTKVEKDNLRTILKEDAKTVDYHFHMQVMPGFVNGTPVRITVKAINASLDSRLRIENERKAAGLVGDKVKVKDDEEIDVPLTEFPFVVIKKGDTRPIGFDPSVKVGDAPADQNLAEKVLPVFKMMGVKQSEKSTVEIGAGGIKINEEARALGDGSEDSKGDLLSTTPRYLRACDIVLKVERPSLKFEIDRGNPFLDGYSQLITPRYARNSPKRRQARLMVVAKWTPPVELTMEELVDNARDGGPADPEFDYLLIATIYFISPYNEPPEEKQFKVGWQTEVQYHQFWNLCHMPAELISMINPEPLRLTVAPIGVSGVTGSLISSLLSPINDALFRYMAQLRAKRPYGKFWST